MITPPISRERYVVGVSEDYKDFYSLPLNPVFRNQDKIYFLYFTFEKIIKI